MTNYVNISDLIEFEKAVEKNFNDSLIKIWAINLNSLIRRTPIQTGTICCL